MKRARLRKWLIPTALVTFLTVSTGAAILRFKYQRPLAEPGLPVVVVESPVPVAITSTSTETTLPATPAPTPEPPVRGEKIDPKFEDAARQNSELQTSLAWTFGGKQQRGWYLYVPLIRRLIGSESAPEQSAFAQALSRWQQSVGLPANGVLDNATLALMVTTWQSRRLKVRGYPSPDQLTMIDTTELYDPARPEELRKAEKETYAAYKRMIAAAAADKSLGLKLTQTNELAPTEKYLKVVSAFRSREYQEKLRQQSPNAGTAGLAVNSPHFTGRALDLYVGGEPVSTEDSNRAIQVQTKVYLWLVEHAESFGFRPYFYEPWHWEYVQ